MTPVNKDHIEHFGMVVLFCFITPALIVSQYENFGTSDTIIKATLGRSCYNTIIRIVE